MPYYNIKSFQKGIGDYDDKGLPGSAKFLSGLDVRRKTDSLQCQQALKDVNTISVTDLIIAWVPANDGNLYGFGNSGKIYKITSSNVLSLVYTDPDGAIKGAAMSFKDDGTKYLCWATDTKLKLKPLPGASDWSDVSTKATNLTSATWHTIKQINDTTYVCNGALIGMLDYTHTWNEAAFNLIPFHSAKTLTELDSYILIGTVTNDGSQRGYLYLWDGSSDRFTRKRKLSSAGVDAVIATETVVFNSSEGLFSTDIVNNTSTVPILLFPGEGASINPDGVNEWKGMALMGVFGNGVGYSGIYSYGRRRLSDSFILNLEFPFDCDEIGAVSVFGTGQDVFMSYRTGSSYGIKMVDQDNKGVGIYEGLDLKSPNDQLEEKSLWTKIRLITKDMPTGTKINCYYRPNKTGAYVAAKLNDDTHNEDFTVGTEAIFMVDSYADILDYKIVITPLANETPEIFNIKSFFE